MSDSSPQEEQGFFDVYRVAATNLRTWLIAYGIGAPVLFLSNDHLWQALVKAKSVKSIAILFLIEVATQVILASINKNAMWFCYSGEGDPAFREKRIYKFSDWLSEQFWIDMGCDVLTMVLFAIATYLTIGALIPGN